MRRHDRLARIALVAVIVAFLGPALAGDRVLMSFDVGRWQPWSASLGPDPGTPSFNADVARFVLPRADRLRRAFAAGELPLWDPSVFLGNPFLALWQTQVLYPPAWLLLGLDARASLAWTVALHLVVTALGAFALLRGLGLPAPPAVAAALALVFGGASALRLSHPSFIATTAWLPACLWAVEGFVRTRRAVWIVGLAGFWTLLILAGQATLVVLSGYLLAAWCAVRAAAADAAPGRVRVALALLGALLAGGLLAAPQLLPSLELAARSARAERDVEALRRTTLAPARAAQLVAPELWGSVRHPPEERLLPDEGEAERSPSFAASVGGYAGAWLPAFAALALLGGGWRGRTWLLGGTVAAALGLALGTPLFDFAHAFLPGFRFSTVNRALPFAAFGLVLLAARGMHLAIAGPVSRARVWSVACVWLTGSTALWAWLRLDSLPDAAGATPAALAHSLAAADRFLLLAAIGGILLATSPLVREAGALTRRGPLARRVWWGALLLALVVELWSFAAPYRVLRPPDRVLPETPALAWLREHGEGRRVARYLPARRDAGSFVEASALSLFGLREVGGFAPLHPETLNRFLAELRWQRRSAWSVGALSDPAAPAQPLFALLATPFLLAPPGVALPGLEKVFEEDLAIWRVPHALPEAFVVPETVPVRGPEEALRRMARPDFDPRRIATVAGAGAPPANAPPGALARAEVRERGSNRIVVEVETAAPGWLVLSEAFAPGWRVRRDGGKPADAVPTNAIFLGSPVAPGRSELAFEYRPASFRLGVGLALAGAVLLAGLARTASRARAPGTAGA